MVPMTREQVDRWVMQPGIVMDNPLNESVQYTF